VTSHGVAYCTVYYSRVAEGVRFVIRQLRRGCKIGGAEPAWHVSGPCSSLRLGLMCIGWDRQVPCMALSSKANVRRRRKQYEIWRRFCQFCTRCTVTIRLCPPRLRRPGTPSTPSGSLSCPMSHFSPCQRG
jgi:hypothetical protein